VPCHTTLNLIGQPDNALMRDVSLSRLNSWTQIVRAGKCKRINHAISAIPEVMKSRPEHASHQGRNSERSESPTFPHGSLAALDGVQFAITLIQGKWKLAILFRLEKGPARLSQLRRLFPEASKKVLVQQLREMARDGLVLRTDLSHRLRHVEYSLSQTRKFAVLQLINMLARWGTQHASWTPGS
jgi:DNA-binding HxlR family transcriptional regulator